MAAQKSNTHVRYVGLPSNILLNKNPGTEMVRDLSFYRAMQPTGSGKMGAPFSVFVILKSTRHVVESVL